MTIDRGPIYTKGKSYRARAEARQRKYRTEHLGAAHNGKYGHLLCEEAATQGKNFVHADAFEAAQERQAAGKGVAPRTFENMLSSQAMCFNMFAPLANHLELAARVLSPFIPGLSSLETITIEYTPSNDVFGDQTGRGGVDCDVLLEGRTQEGRKLLMVVETKFVEQEFSVCGFRKSGRAKKGQAVCPEDVSVGSNRSSCFYTSNKGYKYWQRTDEAQLLKLGALEAAGCPFAGQYWQLWVNLALAHTEARRRGAEEVRFAVCTSPANTKLLGNGEVLDGFKALLRQPEQVSLLDLEQLLVAIASEVPPELEPWSKALRERYGGI